jgi:tetratricopeptide (TPR) repeat protein
MQKTILLIMLIVVFLSCQHEKKAEFHYQEGLKYFSEKKYKEAIESFTLAAELNKYHAKAYYSRGLVYFAKSEYESAFKDFHQSLLVNPLLAEAHVEMGNIQLKRLRPDYGGALKSYTKAIDINQKYTQAYLLRGILRGEMLELDGALHDFNKVLELDPLSYEGLFQRAKIFEKQQKSNAAMEDLNRLLEIKSDFPDGYNMRGLIYLSLKKFKNAADDFELAAKGLDNPGKAYYNLGFARAGLNDFRGALSAYNSSVEHAPGIALTYSERGNTWQNLGNMNEACKDWKIAAGIGNPNAINKFRQFCTE